MAQEPCCFVSSGRGGRTCQVLHYLAYNAGISLVVTGESSFLVASLAHAIYSLTEAYNRRQKTEDRQKHITIKNPEIKNFKPKKILQSSLLAEVSCLIVRDLCEHGTFDHPCHLKSKVTPGVAVLSGHP